MRITKYYSHKISVISFIAIVMVVQIHSYYLEAEAFPIANRVQLFMSGLTSVAVPLFYAISGFFFFSDVATVRDCIPKIKKRFNTLVVPYLIWNLVFVSWYLILSFFPFTSSFVNSDLLSNIDSTQPLEILYFLFIKPAGFHLWFLRDLILFVIISPFLFVAIKRCKWLILIGVFLLTGWMPRFWLTYFVGGGIIAMYYDLENTLKMSNRLIGFVLVSFLLWNIVKVFLGKVQIMNEYVANYIAHITVLVGVMAIWGIYDKIIANTSQCPNHYWSKLSGYGFFIYLFHEPTFNIIKKMTLIFTGVNEYSLIWWYLVNPLLMCLFAILSAKLFSSLFPRIYSVFVGGRIVK